MISFCVRLLLTFLLAISASLVVAEDTQKILTHAPNNMISVQPAGSYNVQLYNVSGFQRTGIIGLGVLPYYKPFQSQLQFWNPRGQGYGNQHGSGYGFGGDLPSPTGFGSPYAAPFGNTLRGVPFPR